LFEPRESVKGDLARAVFYFYTIHKSQADDSYFAEQKQTLYSTWISFKFRTKFSGEQINTLDKWINQRKSEVIIDKALYREKKINRVIND
jgi:endonuclease I